MRTGCSQNAPKLPQKVPKLLKKCFQNPYPSPTSFKLFAMLQPKEGCSTGLETGCKPFLSFYLEILGLTNQFLAAVLKQVLDLSCYD